jgi:hypothetical protein
MQTIPLTQGKIALVDDEDFEAVSTFKWLAHRNYRTHYAQRHMRRAGGGRPLEHMHRVVLERKLGRSLSGGEVSDHINGNGLDNRRDNLRAVTRSQNARNCRRRRTNPSSRYLGVCWYGKYEKWTAKVMVDRKDIFLGYHGSELEAALAREAFIEDRPELHARSNFPPTLWDM